MDSYDINKIINSFDDKEIVNITDEQIDVFIDGVKVTFFNAKWKFLRPNDIQNLNIATLEQIAIMKTNVLFLRAKYRDYYDLYFLSKKFTLNQIYKMSEEILDGLNFKLFVSALLYIEDIEYLKPKENISLEKIRDIFENKIKKVVDI